MSKIINSKILIDIVISKPNFSNLLSQYKALIDTGATRTYISKKIIKELNLVQSNTGVRSDINNVNTPVKLYTCNILFENHSKSTKVEVVEFNGREECDVIIGMDLILFSELIIKNNAFTFIIPLLL